MNSSRGHRFVLAAEVVLLVVPVFCYAVIGVLLGLFSALSISEDAEQLAFSAALVFASTLGVLACVSLIRLSREYWNGGAQALSLASRRDWSMVAAGSIVVCIAMTISLAGPHGWLESTVWISVGTLCLFPAVHLCFLMSSATNSADTGPLPVIESSTNADVPALQPKKPPG